MKRTNFIILILIIGIVVTSLFYFYKLPTKQYNNNIKKNTNLAQNEEIVFFTAENTIKQKQISNTNETYVAASQNNNNNNNNNNNSSYTNVTTEVNMPDENSEEAAFYPLSSSERELVLNIVTGEAGNQPYEGKVAVASCILNACLFEDKRPEEIQTIYGYAGWKSIEEFEEECEKAYGNTILADEVRQAVKQVFDEGEVYNNVYWFYNPSVGYSEFHESMNYINTIGKHKFFGRW